MNIGSCVVMNLFTIDSRYIGGLWGQESDSDKIGNCSNNFILKNTD